MRKQEKIIPGRPFEAQPMFPPFLIAYSHAWFRESNQPGDSTQILSARITRCIKYDDESSDLTINLMLT